MSDSKPATACWLSPFLFALTIAAVTIAAVTSGESPASAQTAAVDRDPQMSCTASWTIGDPYHQGPNFKIIVSFRDQPVFGAKVVLTDETAHPSSGVVATAETDPDGVAHFFAILPGIYQAHIDQALLSPSPEIEVQPNNSSAEEVHIEWPWSPAVTRSVRGRINSWQKDSPQNRLDLRPFAHATVQLLGLRSGKLLASTHTGTDGYYEFAVSSDGLYVLRVSASQDLSGTAYDKAVQVDRQASRDFLPPLEVDHVCGGGLVELPDAVDLQDAAVPVPSGSVWSR